MIDGLVEEVSRSGLFLRAPKWIRPGSSVELDLDLDAGEPLLHLKAEVVRVEHNPSRAGMGLRFVDSPEGSRPLANFIMQRHAKSSL